MVICCGERDSLCCALLGWNPVWFNSETHDVTVKEYLQLKTKAETVYSIPDIDSTGIARGVKLALQYPKIRTAWLYWGNMSSINDRGKACKDLRDAMELHPTKSWFENLLDKALPAQFWTETLDEKKRMKYDMDPEQLHYFLRLHGYYLLDDQTVDPSNVVKQNGYLVSQSSTKLMLNFINRWAQDPENACPKPVRNKVRRLKDPDVQGIDIRDFNFVDCTNSTQLLFFRNCVVEVSKDNIVVRGRDKQPDGHYVWSDKIIDHNFHLLPRPHELKIIEDEEGHKRVDVTINYVKDAEGFDRPISNVQGVYINSSRLSWRKEMVMSFEDENGVLDAAGREAMRAYRHAHHFDLQSDRLNEQERQEQADTYTAKVFGTGYMLFRKKVASRSVALIFLDNKIDEEGKCNGRSGKSFCCNFIKMCGRKVEPFDGRQDNLFGNQFMWQRVTRDTDICYFDDCGQNFKLQNIYSQITGEMKIERKNSVPLVLSAAETPKFMLSSNYVMQDFSPSTMERLLPQIQSDYYHGARPEAGESSWTIHDDFDKELFDDEYSEAEWNADFNFAVYCIQDYLRLSEVFGSKFTPPMRNILKRADLDAMGKPFHDWAKKFFFGCERIAAHGLTPEQAAIPPHLNMEVVRSDVQEQVKLVRGCENMASQTFMTKLRHFANFYDLELNPRDRCNKKSSADAPFKTLRNARMPGYDGPVEVIILQSDPVALSDYFRSKGRTTGITEEEDNTPSASGTTATPTKAPDPLAKEPELFDSTATQGWVPMDQLK
ncbi:MAG: hypothetical protein KBT20_00885 [Bacteroidales bacterium]|nr:hypothetical protein [Candidatus Liminaster caballi]